jgi:hypothetical protein
MGISGRFWIVNVPILHPMLYIYALSCGAASDVFGIHGDKVVYDDGAHGEGTESVGEGVQSVVGHPGEGIGKVRDCRTREMEWSKLGVSL